MKHLTLVKLSDRTPKKEGYYFVVLHNSLKECLWWDEKDGFISRNADKHGVYGWYDESNSSPLQELSMKRFRKSSRFGEFEDYKQKTSNHGK